MDHTATDGTVVTGTGHLSPCRPACPICTDTSDADRSDLPWPAYRWSPELEDQ